MNILYFDEKRNKKDWDTLISNKKYGEIKFEKISGGSVMGRGSHIVFFIHFKGRGQQDRFEKEFNFHILGRDYEVPEDATVIFGPDRPHNILGMDFNNFIMKHKEEFKDNDLVTIKRKDGMKTNALNSWKACKQLLDRKHLGNDSSSKSN